MIHQDGPQKTGVVKCACGARAYEGTECYACKFDRIEQGMTNLRLGPIAIERNWQRTRSDLQRKRRTIVLDGMY